MKSCFLRFSSPFITNSKERQLQLQLLSALSSLVGMKVKSLRIQHFLDHHYCAGKRRISHSIGQSACSSLNHPLGRTPWSRTSTPLPAPQACLCLTRSQHFSRHPSSSQARTKQSISHKAIMKPRQRPCIRRNSAKMLSHP